MKNILLILGLCMLSGCVYYPKAESIAIVESSKREVRNCKLLGQVYGQSDGLFFLSAGLQVAKDNAKEQVSKLGGTNVFWTEVNIRTSPYVLGKAYRCNFREHA